MMVYKMVALSANFSDAASILWDMMAANSPALTDSLTMDKLTMFLCVRGCVHRWWCLPSSKVQST